MHWPEPTAQQHGAEQVGSEVHRVGGVPEGGEPGKHRSTAWKAWHHFARLPTTELALVQPASLGIEPGAPLFKDVVAGLERERVHGGLGHKGQPEQADSKC